MKNFPSSSSLKNDDFSFGPNESPGKVLTVFFTVLKDEGARYGQKEPVKEIIKWKVSKTSEAEKKKKSPV